MNRVCGWCGRTISARAEEGPISHGICEACANEVFSSTPISLRSFLDGLSEPVFLVNGNVEVSFLNRKAQELVGKDVEHAQGKLGGDVFECVNARLPGGCGGTIHCSGCAIRNSVSATYETGESRIRVPAPLRKGDPDHPTTVDLIITTMKRNDAVLLRLDEVGSARV